MYNILCHMYTTCIQCSPALSGSLPLSLSVRSCVLHRAELAPLPIFDIVFIILATLCAFYIFVTPIVPAPGPQTRYACHFHSTQITLTHVSCACVKILWDFPASHLSVRMHF